MYVYRIQYNIVVCINKYIDVVCCRASHKTKRISLLLEVFNSILYAWFCHQYDIYCDIVSISSFACTLTHFLFSSIYLLCFFLYIYILYVCCGHHKTTKYSTADWWVRPNRDFRSISLVLFIQSNGSKLNDQKTKNKY